MRDQSALKKSLKSRCFALAVVGLMTTLGCHFEHTGRGAPRAPQAFASMSPAADANAQRRLVAPTITVAANPSPPPSREERLRSGVATLRAALPEVERSPADALARLRADPSPVARAWAAYLAHHLGDQQSASAILAELESEGERATLAPPGATSAGVRALYLAREHVDLVSSDEDLVSLLPCAVFAWDGAIARNAFGSIHGSTRDALVAPFKARCVAEALTSAMAPARRGVASAASESVARVLFREWPIPRDGTIWTGFSIAAREELHDALLGIPSDPRATDALARAVIGRLATDPRALAHVRNYRLATQPLVGTLAEAICAVSAARGRSVTRGQCERRAYSATLSALALWVGALQGEHGT